MINWNCIIDENETGVKAFANNAISLKSLMRSVSGIARRELRTKVERETGATYGRTHARRALRRRGILS